MVVCALRLFLFLTFVISLYGSSFVSPQMAMARALVALTPPRGGFDLQELGNESIAMVKRLPQVPMGLIKAGGGSFVQTAAVMIPVGLIINGKSLFKGRIKAWLMGGGRLGVDWACISGLFSSGETLVATLRAKDDKWNVYLGSGLASAAMGAKEGPIGAAQGFAAGFAFMFAVDQFLPEENMPSVPMSTQLATRGAGKMQMQPGARRSAAAAAAVKRYKRF